MEINPRELRDVEIRESLRGYNRDEVNDLLERAAATIQTDIERIQQLTERLASAQSEAGRTRETEDVLHRTLLLAQRAADEAVAEATGKSRQMIDDAEMQARRLVAEAEAEARRRGETERQRLDGEIGELAGRRDALLADVEALTRFEAEYRERMTRALEADLFALKSRPTSAPGSRPETSDVATPAADSTNTRLEDAAPAVEAPPEPDSDNGDEPSNASLSTHEVDVRSLFDGSQAVPAVIADEPDLEPAPEVPAVPAPVPPSPTAASDTPQAVDLLGNDGADADVLDDDAFFATLRDAVHDEAPLGPRDENDVTNDHAFFDQDADRGGFRDVFRRRR